MELLKQGRQEGVAGVVERQDAVMEAGEDSLDFLHSLVAAFTAMLVSEFGDRTFLMAAVLSMRHSRLAVLLGSLSAMVAMTLLSVMVGCATVLVPVAVTHYAASVLFAVCGIKMLMEGWSMSDSEGTEEYQEVLSDLDKMETEKRDQARKAGAQYTPGFAAILLQSLTLTLVAEWGDRSQVSTIALAATQDAVGVALGSFLGNAVVTVLAVVAGRLLAETVSVRTVTLVGGLVFNMFALSKLLHP